MNVKYEVLATISLQHDYYTDGRCNDFSIVPSPETQSVLKNLGAIYKVTGSKLLILVRADENGKAFIPVPDGERFVFYMVSENPLFFNITNTTQQPAANIRYYFTNRANDQLSGSVLYLSRKIDAYVGTNVYAVGDLVSDSGKNYEAIKSVGGIDDPESWSEKSADTVAYVNKNDLVEFVAPVYNFTLDTAATSVSVDVYSYNAAGAKVKVGDTITLTYDTARTSGSVLLDKLPAGYYNIDVNGKAKDVYLDATALYQKIFGIIELVTFSDDSRLAMFKTDGTLKQPVYVLQFTSRSVVWKYLAKKDIGSVTYGDYDFYHISDNGFSGYVSNIPIPLVQEIDADDAPNSAVGELALPAVDKLTRYKPANSTDTYFCIEKYLPY